MVDIPGYIAAIGALGIASYGIVEAVGKAFCIWRISPGSPVKREIGLPFVGFREVRKLASEFAPALEIAYGDQFEEILRQQYRSGRGQGEAPDTIRQGVRLGLPFLPPHVGQILIGRVWGLPGTQAEALINALVSEKQNPAPAQGATPDQTSSAPSDLQKLAARFATALDTRVEAVFLLAEEQYQATAKLWAAGVAVALSVGFGFSQGDITIAKTLADVHVAHPGQLIIDILIGLVAVPLGPVAKDLASSLSDALGALSKIRQLKKG